MSGVTEGIDAIASTRVVIREVDSHTSTHALTGEAVHRTFRYDIVFLISFFEHDVFGIITITYICKSRFIKASILLIYSLVL